MKKLSRIKIWTVLVLIVSGLAGLALITSCGTGDGDRNTSSSSSSSGDGNGDDIDVACSISSKGSECSKDDDCKDDCKKKLELSGDYRDECEKLGEDTVTDLVELFEEKLDKPIDDDLDNLRAEDLELMCGAIETIGVQILQTRTDGYSDNRAASFLGWLADKDDVLNVLRKSIKDKEDVLDIIRNLLRKHGGAETDQGTVNGLKNDLAYKGDNNNFLAVAVDSNNQSLVEFIHNEFIDDEEGLCGDESNRPEPDDTVGATAEQEERGDWAEEACILAVYCYIAPTGVSKNQKFRNSVSDIIEFKFRGLIKEPTTGGGLGGTEKDEENLTDDACTKLGELWNNSSGLGLGL